MKVSHHCFYQIQLTKQLILMINSRSCKLSFIHLPCLMIWLGKDLQQRAELEKNRWLHCLGGLNTTRGRHGRSSPSVYQLASFITRTAFYPRMAATHQWHDSSLQQVYNWTTQQLLMSRSLVNNNETVVWCLKEIPSVVCRQSLAGRAGVDSQTARFGVSMSLLFL